METAVARAAEAEAEAVGAAVGAAVEEAIRELARDDEDDASALGKRTRAAAGPGEAGAEQARARTLARAEALAQAGLVGKAAAALDTEVVRDADEAAREARKQLIDGLAPLPTQWRRRPRQAGPAAAAAAGPPIAAGGEKIVGNVEQQAEAGRGSTAQACATDRSDGGTDVTGGTGVTGATSVTGVTGAAGAEPAEPPEPPPPGHADGEGRRSAGGQGKDEWKAWVEALKKAEQATPGRAAAGPTGLPPGFLKRAFAEDPHLLGLFATVMPVLLEHTPRWLSRSRLVALVKTKADGRRKVRSVACGEAVARLVERACKARWGKDLQEAAEHSVAGLKDGALAAAAILQGCIAERRCVLSLDAARAYDAVSHDAIMEALEAAGADEKLLRFVAATLRDREYSVGGERLVPPEGRGMAQGIVFGPLQFQLVAERAAKEGQRAAPRALVITYLDNIYVVADSAEELQAARLAIVAQWAKDGMVPGDAFTVNCALPGMQPAKDNDRILGLGVTGTALERYTRARALAEKVKELGALAELDILKSCVITKLGYDAAGATPTEELRTLQDELVRQIAERAGLPEAFHECVTASVSSGGLGLMPLAEMRNAMILRTGLRMLLGPRSVLTDAAWRLARNPAGRFFSNLAELLVAGGFELSPNAHEVRRGDKLVVRPPSSLLRAARDIAQQKGDGLERGEGSEQLPRKGVTVIGSLFTAGGAKPGLSDDEYKAAVRLHTGAGEEPAEGASGGECPLCGKALGAQGHHRWCAAMPLEPGRQHDAVRDATARWMGEAPTIKASWEVNASADTGDVRIDVVAKGLGGTAWVEVKTIDMRAPSNAGKSFAQLAAKKGEEIVEHYRPHAVVPMVLTAAGAYTRATADTLGQLSAMRHEVAPELAEGVSLHRAIALACARTESKSYGEWKEEVEAKSVAGAVARVGSEGLANIARSRAAAGPLLTQARAGPVTRAPRRAGAKGQSRRGEEGAAGLRQPRGARSWRGAKARRGRAGADADR